jgi:hypothetical protein
MNVNNQLPRMWREQTWSKLSFCVEPFPEVNEENREEPYPIDITKLQRQNIVYHEKNIKHKTTDPL